MVVGVFGHYGNHNLGDEAITEAVVEAIRERRPDAEILAFSLNPADTSKRYGVPAFAARLWAERRADTETPAASPKSAHLPRWLTGIRVVIKRTPLLGVARAARRTVALIRTSLDELGFIVRSFRILRRLDLLLVAGSNQFLDNFGGTWGYPYTLLKWSVLAKLAGAKLAFVSVGAGPLDRGLSRLFVRLALRVSDYTSFRDAASRRMVRGEGRRNANAVFPDLAHGLQLLPQVERAIANPPRSRPLTIAVNPMPLYDKRYWCVPDDGEYRRYVRRLAAAVSSLLREGYPVFFVGTQLKDEDVARDVIAVLDAGTERRLGEESLIRRPRTVQQLIETLASADVVIATRFHGTLLSFLAERPVVGICYYRKAMDLMKEMGQGEYGVPLESFEPEDLLERLRKLETEWDVEHMKIQRKNREYREALSRQYKAVLALLRAAR